MGNKAMLNHINYLIKQLRLIANEDYQHECTDQEFEQFVQANLDRLKRGTSYAVKSYDL